MYITYKVMYITYDNIYIWEVPEMGGLAVLIPLKVAGSSSVQADVAVNKTLIT